MLLLTGLALALPSFLVTNCWLDFLGANSARGARLLIPLESPTGAAGVMSLLLWPLPALMAVGALRRLDGPLLEVEPALRGFKLVRCLLWPAARPAIALGGTIVFVLALNQFAVPAILQVKVFPA